MKKLVCRNPEIFEGHEATLWLNVLLRAGVAHRNENDNNLIVVDWRRATSERLRNVGKKGEKQILAWAQSAQQPLALDGATPIQASATCPHCGNLILLVAPEPPRQ
jgi:hypothetical protein